MLLNVVSHYVQHGEEFNHSLAQISLSSLMSLHQMRGLVIEGKVGHQ